MKLGMSVPTHFVLMGEMFDRQAGLNMAEFEFPAYFNFFCLKKKVTLICHADMETRIRAIFTETLMGPEDKYCIGEADHADTLDSSAYPNFREEGYYLDGLRRELNVDTLLQFMLFDAKNEVILGEDNDPEKKVVIKYDMMKKQFIVSESNSEGKNHDIATIQEKFTYVTSR